MKRYNVNDVLWKYTNTEDIEKLFNKKVFAGNDYEELLQKANKGEKPNGILQGSGSTISENKEIVSEKKGFIVSEFLNSPYLSVSRVFPYIIIEKEPERKPFDLSDAEVRNFLRDKWIRRKNDSYEKKITYFSKNSSGWKCCNISAYDLFKEWEFIEPVKGSIVIGELK